MIEQSMDAKSALGRSLAMADTVISELKPADLTNSTPCSEWDLRALLNHIVYELVWVPDMLAGKTVAEVGSKHDGDLLGDDPVAAWKVAERQAKDAAEQVKDDAVVHISAGDVSPNAYMEEVASDMLIHGWDVAKSLNHKYEIQSDLLDWAEAVADRLMKKYGAYGVFGTPLTPPEGADRQTKLLALLGRQA